MLSDHPFLLSVKNRKPFPAAFQQRLQVRPYVHAHVLGLGGEREVAHACRKEQTITARQEAQKRGTDYT